jgi:hypothetical protein
LNIRHEWLIIIVLHARRADFSNEPEPSPSCIRPSGAAARHEGMRPGATLRRSTKNKFVTKYVEEWMVIYAFLTLSSFTDGKYTYFLKYSVF